jgi:raffinose/stachyose/melibiose transport system substrate-binding protein
MPRSISRKGFLRLGGVGLAGAALLGAADCSGSLGNDKKVVRFFTGTEETTIQERAVTEIQVNRFEEQHPKYTLEREAIDPDEMGKVIPSRLRSDEPPDVFSYDTGPGFGGVLTEAGLLRPLEDAYQQRGWGIYEWAKQRATYNGTLYGVPDQVEEIVVYYNKDLMPEVPETVDELRQIANGLKGRGIIPFAFGNQEQWPAGHMFSTGVSNVLGREGSDDILYADGRWDTPEVEEAIHLFFRDFVQSGYYPEGLSSLSYDEANALFYTGEAAMNPTGTWLVPEIVQTVQDFGGCTLLVCCICYYTRGDEFLLSVPTRKDNGER